VVQQGPDDELHKLVEAFDGPVKKVPPGARGPTRIRAGRPRQAGERYPGGQLKPADGSMPLSPALVRRIFRAAEEGYADARLASQVGRLLHQRQLTSAEAATGFHIGEIYGRFEAQHGRRRAVRSPSYESGFSAAGAGQNIDDEDDERALAIDANWKSLQDELEEFTQRMRRLLEALCVDDEAINSRDLADVRPILGKLAAFFRSGRSKKRRRRTAIGVVRHEPREIPIVTPAPRRIDRDKEAWLAVQRKLSPQLDERELQDGYGIFVAVKDRARFNESKSYDTARIR